MNGAGDGDQLLHRHRRRHRDDVSVGDPGRNGKVRLTDHRTGDCHVPIDIERRGVVEEEPKCGLSIEGAAALARRRPRRNDDAEAAGGIVTC
jgi:hypothetical protein